MNICVLVLIHELKEQQILLLEHLSKDFDVFVHIDKKSNVKVDQVISLSTRIKAFKEYKIYWGHHNMIFATLLLLQQAIKNMYDYYILISGADVPIKSNRTIYEFFNNKDTNYIDYNKFPLQDWPSDDGGFGRIDYFYTKLVGGGEIVRFIRSINLNYIIPLWKKIGLKRKHLKMDFYGGAQWFNLTKECVTQILNVLQSNKKILNRFKYTKIPDEIFFQTIIKNFVHDVKIDNNSLRFIDWSTGPEYPHVFRSIDFERLRNSKALFARKFNSETDFDIIKKCYCELATD